MVAPEFAPWVRETETGEMVAALSKAVRQLGHEVTVVTPRSPAFEEGGLLAARRLTPLELEGGLEGATEATIFDGQLASGVKLVLLEWPALLEASRGDKAEKTADGRRAVEFSAAAAAFIRQRVAQGEGPDAVHAFEWQTAPLAALLRESELPPVLFTVTDPTRRGSAAAKDLSAVGVAEADMATATAGGRTDLVSLGVANADVCAVASPAYADELQKAGGPGGDSAAVFEANAFKLVGITPGIDYAVWNPATDPALPSRFAAEEAEAKGSCKTALVRALGLELDTSRPLIAIVGELDRATGADVVVAALARLLKQGSSVVFAGTAQGALRAKIETAGEKASGLCAFLDDPDDGTLHRVLGASDIVLVPSRRAPLPRIAQIAQRYGAAPVCHEVDTLADAVVDCDSSLGTGTGFLFEEPSARDLLAATARAVAGYGSGSWSQLVRRMMRLDVGWDRPARRYAQVYRQLTRGIVPTAD